MMYTWSLEVIMRDGTHFTGEHESELASSGEVIYDLLYEDRNTLRAFFAFQDPKRREVYVISPDDIAALILTAPIDYI